MTNPYYPDNPTASGVIETFLCIWWDDLGNEYNDIRALVPSVANTRTNDRDEVIRAWMVADWVVRTYLPAWLELAKMTANAEDLRTLPPLAGKADWKATRETVVLASDTSHALWYSIRPERTASRINAEDAAGKIAFDTAQHAAQCATWYGIGNASIAAAEAAMITDNRDEANGLMEVSSQLREANTRGDDDHWDAATKLATEAADNAIRSTTVLLGPDATQPTVSALQKSALELADRLIAVGKTP